MKHKPYTLSDAFHAEIKSWKLSPSEYAFMLAFTFCLKERMEGREPLAIFKKPITRLHQ